MSQQAREPGTVIDAVSIEQWRIEHHPLKQEQVQTRSWGEGARERAHPLEFDEDGFPVAQRSASFVDRVTRLLKPL